jgi:ATP:ADP antiporter, AAA family
MKRWVRKITDFFLGDTFYERIKTLLLSFAFFLIVGSYTLVRELRDTVFINVVGQEYIPVIRFWGIFALIPAIFVFSRLVDFLKRHQLMYFYSVVYGFGLLIIAHCLAHPVIGLANKVTSGDRFFGWIVYVFLEGFSPFVVSLFWSFVNSITNPEEAQKNYTFITAGSKLGGMTMTGLALWWLTSQSQCGIEIEIYNLQLLFGFSGILLLFVPFIIHLLMKKIPFRYLHGYEAAYEADKKMSKEQKEKVTFLSSLRSMGSGLIVIFKYPYVMGIFGTVFFWETIKAVFSYYRLASSGSNITPTELACYLLIQAFFLHCTGFFIALFGARTIVGYFGERKSLILVPVVIGFCILFYLLSNNSAQAIAFAYIFANAVNYAFTSPLREALYVPTTREMKFKSKSWIDAFGAKIGKGFGSMYTGLVAEFGQEFGSASSPIFFTILLGGWLWTAHLLGRRFERAIKDNEVIGFD